MIVHCIIQETVASATLLADSLKGELADGQRKLVTLAENASANAACLPPVTKQMNGGLPDKVIFSTHSTLQNSELKKFNMEHLCYSVGPAKSTFLFFRDG